MILRSEETRRTVCIVQYVILPSVEGSRNTCRIVVFMIQRKRRGAVSVETYVLVAEQGTR